MAGHRFKQPRLRSDYPDHPDIHLDALRQGAQMVTAITAVFQAETRSSGPGEFVQHEHHGVAVPRQPRDDRGADTREPPKTKAVLLFLLTTRSFLD